MNISAHCPLCNKPDQSGHICSDCSREMKKHSTMTSRITQYGNEKTKVRPLGSSRDVVSHINAQKRAENLFIAAEKLGLDAPTEAMLHEEFNHIICETVTDVCMWLDRNNLENVSKALVDAARRQELENAIG